VALLILDAAAQATWEDAIVIVAAVTMARHATEWAEGETTPAAAVVVATDREMAAVLMVVGVVAISPLLHTEVPVAEAEALNATTDEMPIMEGLGLPNLAEIETSEVAVSAGLWTGETGIGPTLARERGARADRPPETAVETVVVVQGQQAKIAPGGAAVAGAFDRGAAAATGKMKMARKTLVQ
jgi:hypothetical protein